MSFAFLDATARVTWHSATAQQSQLEGLTALWVGNVEERIYSAGGTLLTTVLHDGLSINTATDPRRAYLGPYVSETKAADGTASYAILSLPGSTDILRCDVSLAGQVLSTNGRTNLADLTPGGLVILATASLPAWIGFTPPASGAIAAIGSHTLYDVVSDVNERFSLSKVLGAWGSAAIVRVRDGDGLLTELIYAIFGGGHGDTGNDAVYAWRSSTQQFEVMLAASSQVIARLFAPAPANSFGEEDTGTLGRPASVHAYQTNQALDTGEGLGPAFLNTRALAVGSAAPATGQAHWLDVDASPPVWARYGGMQPFNANTGWVAVVKDKSRQKFFMFENDSGTRFLECDYTSLTPTWIERNQVARSTNFWGGSNLACAVWDENRDIYLATGGTSGLVGLDATDPTDAWVTLTVSGTGPGTAMQGSKIWHRRKDDTFIAVDTSTNPPTGIYVWTPPATWNSGTWTVTRRSFTGTSTYSNMAGPWNDYERFQYIEEADALIVCPSGSAAMECWAL